MKNLIERNKKVKYRYSESSLKKLIGVHPKLIEFAFRLADIIDIKIVYGKREDEEQYQLFKEGKSSKDGVTDKSEHQEKDDGLVYALDMLPLPRGVNMYLDDGNEDNIRWAEFNGACLTLAHCMGITIRTGFKWRNNLMDSLARPERDNTLPDGNHVEIIL